MISAVFSGVKATSISSVSSSLYILIVQVTLVAPVRRKAA